MGSFGTRRRGGAGAVGAVGFVAAALALALLAGCAAAAGRASTPTSPSRTPVSTAATTPPTQPSGGIPPAALGTPARSQRITFVPKEIRLLASRTARARVLPVDVHPDGALALPSDAGDVGWWVGGALPGELFGAVVLAGHIDSRTSGIGFFARLLDVRPGDRIELVGDQGRLTYVVRSNREVAKDVLSRRGEAFDRTSPGRLALVTCTGRFDPTTRHYDHNLLVIADPVGTPARG